MNTISITVTENHLELIQDTVTTQGSINYDNCHFTFDSVWTGFTKYAVFSVGDSSCYRVALADDSCSIPQKCMEKEGIIRIGVYGINDDNVVITTNSVAHYINEGICNSTDWIEEDNNLVKNAILQLNEYANEYKNTLETKFNNLVENTRETGDVLQPQAGKCMPDDWFIPESYTTAELCPIKSKGSTFDDYMNYAFTPLLKDFPEYVSMESIGTDSTNTYSVNVYSFSPDKYEKTVLITSYVHGVDRTAFFSLGNFVDRLCRNYKNNTVLNYIRNNVKLVVVPSVNPYAMVHSTVNNSNDVNIGLNFPFRWDECLISSKGSSFANQTETINMICLLDIICEDKLCAAIDLHNSTITTSGRTLFYPKGKRNCITALTQLVNNFNFSADSDDLKSTAIIAASSNPTLTNYIADTYGINTCELVWNDSIYGGVKSNVSITKYTEYIGNTVLTMVKNSGLEKATPPSPFLKQLVWSKSCDTDVFSIPMSSEFQKMGISAYSFSLSFPAIVSVNGFVTIQVYSDCVVKINPVLYQDNVSSQQYSDRVLSNCFTHEIELTPGTHVIPVSSVLQGYYSCYNDASSSFYSGKVRLVLAFCASLENAAKVNAYSVTVNATPSDIANCVEISHPMGNVSDYSGEDVPTQSLLYPINAYSDYDSMYND